VILYANAQKNFKYRLRDLALTHLNQYIQTGSHDSIQDAIAAVGLVKLKIMKGADQETPSQSLFEYVKGRSCFISCVDQGKYSHSPNLDILHCADDEEVR